MAKKTTSKKSAKKTIKPAVKPKRPAAAVKRDGMVARRADLGAAVGVHFATLPQPQRGIAEKLHALVTKAAPKATHAVKWGMPVYEHHGMLCYIRSRPKYVTLGFYFSGARLKDPKGLLTGTGENMRHAKLALDAPIPEKDLTEFVRQAVKVNESGAA
jgi:hypothetical protein